MLEVVRRLLTIECDVVACVTDGVAALETTLQTVPDVVVLDVNMPKMDGLKVCRELSTTAPHIRVVVLTAMVDADMELRALAAGASAFLHKSELLTRLRPIIRSVIAAPPGNPAAAAS